MLGEKIGEEHGKIATRRILPGDDKMSFVKMEITIETEVTMYGVAGMNIGTYTAYERGPGQMYAEGQGIIMTQDGEGAIWNGHGVATMDANGTMHVAASVAFQTTSQKLSKLNTVLALVEHHATMDGKADSALFEWKGQ